MRHGRTVRPLDNGYRRWRDKGWRREVQQIKSQPDPAVRRVADQSLESATAYVSNLSMGSTIAVKTKDEDDSVQFWLACKHSEPYKSKSNDVSTGTKKGELLIDIIWYDRLTALKYRKLDDITHVSVLSVVVTKSRIM